VLGKVGGKDRTTHMDEGESGGRRAEGGDLSAVKPNCLSCKCLVQRGTKRLEQAELPPLVPGIAHFCCQPHPNRAVRMHLSNAA
jgi:hypothetical protein